MTRFGLDSNVFVYVVDAGDQRRHERARDIVDRAASTGRCVLASQSVGEFYSVVTRKRIAEPAAAERKASEMLAMFTRLVVPDDTAIRLALDAASRSRFSYWDALLLATLGGAGCSVVLSEDMHDGATLAGVTVRDPFVGALLPADLDPLLS